MPDNNLRVRVRERPVSAADSVVPASTEPSPLPLNAITAAPVPAAVPPATPARGAAYEVGYRKPPKGSQFQPGRSGNPKGRPKKHSTISGAFEAELQAKHPITINGRATRLTQAEIVAKQTLKKAMAGDPRATELIFKLEMARKHIASRLAPRSSNPGLQDGVDDGSASLDVPFSPTDRAMMAWFLSTRDADNDDVAVSAIGVHADDQVVDDENADDDETQVSAARGGLARRRVP